MTYDFSDGLMTSLLSSEFELSMKEYTNVTPPPLSKAFHKKMRQYLHRGKSRVARIALVAAIIIALSATTVMAVEPLREKFFEIIEMIFSDRTTVSFTVDEALKIEGEFKEFEIVSLPEGFEQIDEFLWKESAIGGSVYVNEAKGKTIDFKYGNIAEIMVTLTSEDEYPPRTRYLGDTEVKVYFDGEVTTLVWTYDEYGFFLSSNLDENELFSYIERVKLK